jgi:IclR family pca regulon transcriptional regulator
MTETDSFVDSRDYVQSLARGLAVLRAFGGDTPNLSLAGIAARTGLSRAAARRLVLTLEHLGYVKSHGRDYALSPRVLELGLGYVGSLQLSDLVQPHIEALAQRIQHSCSLAVLDGQSIVYVLRVPVQRLMTVSLSVGSRLPAYCASMGRVLVSGLPDDELRTWLGQCHPVRQTQHTVTDPRRLRRLVESVRTDGYAYVEQELELGLCSIAVPLRDREGHVVAALNASMPYHEDARRLAVDKVLPALRATAVVIEHSLPARTLPPVSL